MVALVLTCAAARAQTAAPAIPAKPPAEKGPAAKAAAVPAPKDLKFPPLRPVPAPNVEAVTLPNGMRVFLVEDHELPVINGSALIRTGNLFDPPDKIGLAALTGAVMRAGGTKTKTAEQLNLQLENLAASVESVIGETSGSVSFFALKENAGPVLEAFRDVLTAPEFLQGGIDLQKSQMTSAISRRNDDAGKVAERELTSVLYGRDSPFGWREQYDTINRINRTDLQNFYQRYYFPKNVMLEVWGDFDTAAMKASVAALFAGWTVEQPPVPEFPKVKDAPAPGIYLAEKKEDVKNAFFALGHSGGELKDKDYPALEIMADILGGGFHSRLGARVRTRMGNAYDISARWGVDFDHPGLFEISGSANPVSIVETLKAIREEVERIRAAEVTEDELRTAKDAALNRMVFAFDTKAKTLGRVLTYEYYGYPRDFLQQYQMGLMAVTRADVLRVARHLNPANLAVVIVGNPLMFGQPLEASGGPVNKLDLTIPEPKPEVMKGDQASLAQGKRILLRAQQAAGGADKLAAVKDYTRVEELLLTPENGGMKMVQTDRWIAPATFRQDSVLQTGKLSAYSDGGVGWIAAPQGWGALGGAQLKQMQGDLFRLYFRLMLSDRIAGRTVNALNSTTLEISDPTGQMATVECDAGTGLPQKLRYDLPQAAGAPLKVTEEFDDFRDVGGVKIPHKITISRGGRKFADVTVTDYKVNAGLEVRELARRP